ncbi:unnamed protein product, partial [Didymodactylos carnosus]
MSHGCIPADRDYSFLTWKEIESMPDKENVVIIQPVGAVEQHGLHLPLAIDYVIGLAVVGKALALVPSDIRAYSLPSQQFGNSVEHISFPGTISLTPTTLISVLTEIGESVYRAGFRKFVFSNSHGGNLEITDLVARSLRVSHSDFL